MKKENKTKIAEKKENKIVVGTRGRSFQGVVTKIFGRRAVVEFERTVYVPKYERFAKKKTRLHARIPEGMNLEVGDYVKIRETRRLSKIVNFLVIEIMRKAEVAK